MSFIYISEAIHNFAQDGENPNLITKLEKNSISVFTTTEHSPERIDVKLVFRGEKQANFKEVIEKLRQSFIGHLMSIGMKFAKNADENKTSVLMIALKIKK